MMIHRLSAVVVSGGFGFCFGLDWVGIGFGLFPGVWTD
jgi:hypothetical protein